MSRNRFYRSRVRNDRMEWPGFPVNSLPDLFYKAAKLLYDITLAPFPLIVMQLMTALSLAAQGGYDVKGKANGGTIPISLYMLCLARSGERKSTVAKLALRFFREENRKLLEQYQQDLKAYHVDIDIWKTEKKALDQELKKAMKNEDAHQECRERLQQHLENIPEKPVLQQVLYENTTVRALLEGLRGRGVSAGVISDEGGTVVDSDIFTHPAMPNSVWSGQDSQVNRMDDRFVIEDARLTISIQVQPEVWLDNTRLRENFIRESGLFSRFLFCYPWSTQGSRFDKGDSVPSLDDSPEWHQYEALLEKLFREAQNNGGKRKVIEVIDQNHLINLYNHIEGDLNEGCSLSDFTDVGSKVGENTLRVAALFSLCDSAGEPAGISPQCIDAAHDYVAYHVNEFREIFSEDALDRRDTELLWNWMDDHHTDPRWFAGFPVSDILREGPNALRKDGRMKRAIYRLAAMNPDRFMLIDTEGKTPGRPGPQYFVSVKQFNELWNKKK